MPEPRKLGEIGTLKMLTSKGDPKQLRQLGSFGAVGLEIGIAVGIGAAIGHYLDTRFGLAPWGMALGLFSGIGAAIKALCRVVSRYQRAKLREAQDEVLDDSN